MIISFAWTTYAFLARRKTVTRREWDDEYAERFKTGSIHQAYDKSPRYGGKQIGRIQILSITREPIVKMPESDYDAEGFKYMEEQGLTIWKKPPRQAFERWKPNGGSYWVVRFKVLED